MTDKKCESEARSKPTEVTTNIKDMRSNIQAYIAKILPVVFRGEMLSIKSFTEVFKHHKWVVDTAGRLCILGRCFNAGGCQNRHDSKYIVVSLSNHLRPSITIWRWYLRQLANRRLKNPIWTHRSPTGSGVRLPQIRWQDRLTLPTNAYIRILSQHFGELFR